jgi:flagellar biosynthesis anti-sigma factor FlgM
MVRISGTRRPGSISTTKKSGGKSAAKSGGSGGETVQVADAASLREKAQVMLANLPEVRLDRIEEIRSSIERGEYEVSGKKVASRIVLNALAERPW